MTFTLPTVNDSGLVNTIVWESGQIPYLGPGILLLVFLVIALTGFFHNERRLGRSNMAQWLAIAGLITTVGAFILFLYPGIINLETLVICVVLTIIFVLWFLFTNPDSSL